MKHFLLLIFVVFTFYPLLSQNTIWNRQFEQWEDFGAFEEPKFWSSLKTADNLSSSAPIVLFKDNTGMGGSLCARLEVKGTPFGFNANGIMTSGRVHAELDPENGSVYTDINDAEFHQVVIYRPDSIIGYYKYDPAAGDKGKVEAVLHHQQDSLPSVNEAYYLARARFDLINPTPNWTRFSAPFTYIDMVTDPEYLLTVMTAGDSTVSKVGSVAWFDDFDLVYNWSSTIEFTDQDLELKILPSQLKGNIQTNENLPLDIYLFDASGKKVLHKKDQGNSFDLSLKNIQEGVYITKIQAGNAVFTRKFYLSH